MSIPEDTSVYRRHDVYTRQVGFDLVVLDAEHELLHVLNSVGSVVWHSISPDRSLRQIADAVCLAFDLPTESEEQVLADVIYFAKRLRQNSLLEEKPGKQEAGTGEEICQANSGNNQPIQVTIPDREISRVDAKYQPPSIKTLTLDEVDELNKIEGGFTPRFADTWHPDQPD